MNTEIQRLIDATPKISASATVSHREPYISGVQRATTEMGASLMKQASCILEVKTERLDNATRFSLDGVLIEASHLEILLKAAYQRGLADAVGADKVILN